jgi:hypothetical protein
LELAIVDDTLPVPKQTLKRAIAAWITMLVKNHLWVYSKHGIQKVLSTPGTTGIIGVLIGQLLNSNISKLEVIKK